MSEVSATVTPIVTGLTSSHGDIVLIALVFCLVFTIAGLVLFGTYKIFNNASNFIAKTITDQLKMLGEDVKKTGDVLVSMQESQIHFTGKLDNFDGRLGKVEEKVEKLSP